MKLLWILTLVIIAFRLFAGRWPWDLIRPYRTRREAVMRARRLLGVDPGASRADIQDAHRRLITAVHPDRGGTDAKVHEANDARDLLFNELPEEN